MFHGFDYGLEVLVLSPLGVQIPLRPPQELGDAGGNQQASDLLQLGLRAGKDFHRDRAFVEKSVDDEVGLA